MSDGVQVALATWVGLAFVVVVAAYVLGRPEVLGKRVDGRLRPWTVPVLLPYFALGWVCWFLLRYVDREPVAHRLLPELWLGRRAFASELPAGIRAVVDLTAEFAEPAAVREGCEYLAEPLLDAAGTSPRRLSGIVDRMRAMPTPIYLHCAQGHGRTGMVAVAFLVATERAESIDAGLSMVQATRPRVRLGRGQRRALERWAAANR